MKALMRLERMEKARSAELHIHHIHQRMCQMSEHDAQEFFDNMTSRDAMGVLKYDRMVEACHRGREVVRAEMEASGEYHEEWIEWFLDGKFDWKDLEERAQEAYVSEEERK